MAKRKAKESVVWTGTKMVEIDGRDAGWGREMMETVCRQIAEAMDIRPQYVDEAFSSARCVIAKLDFLGRDAIVVLSQKRCPYPSDVPDIRGDVKVVVRTPGEHFSGNGFYLYTSPSPYDSYKRVEASAFSDTKEWEKAANKEAALAFDKWYREQRDRIRAYLLE